MGKNVFIFCIDNVNKCNQGLRLFRIVNAIAYFCTLNVTYVL